MASPFQSVHIELLLLVIKASAYLSYSSLLFHSTKGLLDIIPAEQMIKFFLSYIQKYSV